MRKFEKNPTSLMDFRLVAIHEFLGVDLFGIHPQHP
jgi:hypothetical protein